jgi:hypothetical protein
MDDVRMLSALLTKPDPATEVIDRGRHQLQNAARGPVRRRRVSRPLAGLGLAGAAAATAAIVVVSGGAKPTASPNGPPAAASLSGRQILLAAATTAESRPVGSGTYWHVKTIDEMRNRLRNSHVELWTRRDGREYIGLKDGTAARDHGAAEAFSMAGAMMTFAQIQQLPTDPGALKAKIARVVEAQRLPKKLMPSKEGKDGAVLDALTSLLSRIPAPPKVRAAAFRGIASFPNVKDLGTVTGGRALQISFAGGGNNRMVIDPKTSLVKSWTVTAGHGLAQYDTTGSVLTAEWTNTLPRIVPMPK